MSYRTAFSDNQKSPRASAPANSQAGTESQQKIPPWCQIKRALNSPNSSSAFALEKPGLMVSCWSVFNDGLIRAKPDQYSLSTDELRLGSGDMTQSPARMRTSYRSWRQGRITLWTQLAPPPGAFQSSSPSVCTQEQRGFAAPVQGECRGRDTEDKAPRGPSWTCLPSSWRAMGTRSRELRPQPEIPRSSNFGPWARQEWVRMLPWKRLLNLLCSGTLSNKTQKVAAAVRKRSHARSLWRVPCTGLLKDKWEIKKKKAAMLWGRKFQDRNMESPLRTLSNPAASPKKN